MNIYKNFLSKEKFKKLESYIMGDHFPWYFNEAVVVENDDYFQFTYVVFREGEYNCSPEYSELFKPILSKINAKKLCNIKANLLTRTMKIIEHGFHIDDRTTSQGKTGILYMNNCNGYTKFENGKKIISEENKYVEFDCKIKHTGSSCTDEKRRVVINFNYE